MSVNSVTLSGILARDPQLRYVNNKPETMLSVICTTYEPSSGGKWQKVSTTIPVIVKGQNAERVAGWFSGGSAVEIEGKLKGFKIQSDSHNVTVCAVLARRVDSPDAKGGRVDER
jgi:single-stranded DNA-binding protein